MIPEQRSQSTNAAPIKVYGEATPNPNSWRFVCTGIISEQPAEFKSAKECLRSPLAKKLFGFPWTAAVFIGRDFVSVTKQDWVEWEVLVEPLAGLIEEHLERGEPVLLEASPETSAPVAAPEAPSTEAESIRLIKKVIEEEIRPAVALDGGDVTFADFVDGVVSVHMRGSCAGCPSSVMTLKDGIEVRLKEVVPSVREVVSVT